MHKIRQLFLLLILLIGSMNVDKVVVYGEFVGAIILPHGDAAYDPTIYATGKTERNVANEIHIGSLQTAQWFANVLNPDIIFISSPHGIALSNDYSIYLADTASGYADIATELNITVKPPYKVYLPTISLDKNKSNELLDRLNDLKFNVSGVVVPSDGSIDMPLHWGEVIPLLLIPPRRHRQDHCRPCHRDDTKLSILSKNLRRTIMVDNSRDSDANNNNRFKSCCSLLDNNQDYDNERKLIIWTYPLRRYNHSIEMIFELLQIGYEMRQYFDNVNKKMGVIISGDLSHTHQMTGPYGYSNTSQLYDNAIGIWANNPCVNADALLITAAQYQPTALSCGYTGFVLLHGMLCGTNSDHHHDVEYDSRVIVNHNVTYFGMMAAQFQPKNNKKRD